MEQEDMEFDLETGEEIKKAPAETAQDTDVENGGADEHGDDHQGTGDDASNDDDHDNDDDDNGAGDDPNASDDQRESIRERRRLERKNRKAAQKEREETLRRELAARDTIINELRGKVDIIERRNSGSELAKLEGAKQQTAQAYAYYKSQIEVATTAGDGAGVANATEKMLQAQRKFDELANYERAYRQQQATPQPLDQRLVNHAKDWMSKNKWYNPSGTDQDSRIALAIDQQMGNEGWDPTTPAYWSELSSRVKKYLPHRANSGKIETQRPKSVVTGPGREASPRTSATNTYRLSAERISALKDAGIWDDPKQRADAIKRFRDFDKQNKVGG